MKLFCRIDHKAQKEKYRELQEKLQLSADPSGLKGEESRRLRDTIKELCSKISEYDLLFKCKDLNIKALQERIEIQEGMIKELRRNIWCNRDGK